MREIDNGMIQLINNKALSDPFLRGAFCSALLAFGITRQIFQYDPKSLLKRFAKISLHRLKLLQAAGQAIEEDWKGKKM